MTTRKSQQDWFITGINLLVESGPKGLTIDELCRRLEVTKGSFYHHFGGYDDFKARLLTFFEQEGTLEIIKQTEQEATPEGKLRRLLSIIVDFSAQHATDPEVALRAWALQDADVRALQSRVDARRMDYVQSLCQDIAGDATQAKLMSQTLYAILVGSEQIQPPIRGASLQALFDEVLRLYGLTPTGD